jgi:hypothetical protein
MPALAPMKSDAAISIPRDRDLDVRPPVATNLGPILFGAAMPHPDPQDPLTMVAGAIKRFATAPPPPNVHMVGRLRQFVNKWLKKNLTPLDPSTDLSIEAWLTKTNYPAWRKQELREKWDKVGSAWEKRWHGVKSFMKDETYETYKHARGINSRTDEFKVAVGPMFKAIEEELFKHRSFIKHVPVAKRAKYITEMLYREGGFYMQTDYTSFEALLVPLLMEATEFQLYEYMTAKIPGGPEFMRLIREVLGGLNWCEYRDFFVVLRGTRMSGEMCTSSGNGFDNLMFELFVLEEVRGCSDVAAVVEGDDGLGAANGTPPTSDDFLQLGLNVKLVIYYNLAEAGFCGMVFDPMDQLVVTDPREVLASFGWSSGRYARSNAKTLRVLLRCKALSLAHQYPGCPVICELAQYGLRVTRDVKNIHMYRVLNSRKAMSGWERDQLLNALKDESKIQFIRPPINTRLLVEKLYNLPIEYQLLIESQLRIKDDLGPIKTELLTDISPPSWRHYWQFYVGYADDERRPALNVSKFQLSLPCWRKGKWLVAPGFKGRLPRLTSRVTNITYRAKILGDM